MKIQVSVRITDDRYNCIISPRETQFVVQQNVSEIAIPTSTLDEINERMANIVAKFNTAQVVDK